MILIGASQVLAIANKQCGFSVLKSLNVYDGMMTSWDFKEAEFL